jgi:hypothetical protein
MMLTTITLPSPPEILERIRSCRDELAALRKLLRLARAAEAAEEARGRRTSTSSREGGPVRAE